MRGLWTRGERIDAADEDEDEDEHMVASGMQSLENT